MGQFLPILAICEISIAAGTSVQYPLQQAQMEVAISTPLLESSFKNYRHMLTFCWIKILWKYLWKNNISLQNSEQVLPKLQ
jgi:hypothetical protein